MTDISTEEKWLEAMKAKGHMPKLDDDGGLDLFVLDVDFHNGPGCTICFWNCCMNCEGVDDIPECDVLTLECVDTTVKALP